MPRPRIHARHARSPCCLGARRPSTGANTNALDVIFFSAAPPIATHKHDHEMKSSTRTAHRSCAHISTRALARSPAHALLFRDRRCSCACARPSRTRASFSSRPSAAAPAHSAPTGTLASDATQYEPPLDVHYLRLAHVTGRSPTGTRLTHVKGRSPTGTQISHQPPQLKQPTTANHSQPQHRQPRMHPSASQCHVTRSRMCTTV